MSRAISEIKYFFFVTYKFSKKPHKTRRERPKAFPVLRLVEPVHHIMHLMLRLPGELVHLVFRFPGGTVHLTANRGVHHRACRHHRCDRTGREPCRQPSHQSACPHKNTPPFCSIPIVCLLISRVLPIGQQNISGAFCKILTSFEQFRLSFVPPAGVMKFLLDFFPKKSRESRGQSPLAGVQGTASPGKRRFCKKDAKRRVIRRFVG